VTYFKVLDGYKPTNGGNGRYPGVGRWTRHLDPDRLEACKYGYHLAEDDQLIDWLGPAIFEAEPCGDHTPVDGGNKWVSCRVRLTRRLSWDVRVARLFAADCAEAALLGERASGREPDERSWAAVTAARRFADGEISREELAAAWAAAGAAAGAAARDAAWAAARAAAWAAAWDAARAAARDAAWAAAGAAAWAAARDAAWAAARAAAWAALYPRLIAYLLDRPIPSVEPLYGVAVPV
jgi:hypothetical protein